MEHFKYSADNAIKGIGIDIASYSNAMIICTLSCQCKASQYLAISVTCIQIQWGGGTPNFENALRALHGI